MTVKMQPKRGLFEKNKSCNIPSDKIELFAIAVQMRTAKLSSDFIVEAVEVALQLEGVADLMHLWAEESDQEERDEIIADIQDLIDLNKQKEKVEEIYVRFNDLAEISRDIRGFKDSLYQEVMKRGGINKLSELTGIPQSSLSRFFNSNSMPRRSTVLAIAKALDLNKLPIDLKWSK